MTGESLINASYDNMTKRVVQGSGSGVDFILGSPTLLETIAFIFALAFVIWLVRRALKSGKK